MPSRLRARLDTESDDADEIAVEKGDDTVVAAGAVGCVVVVDDDIGEPNEEESNKTGL